MNPPARTFRSIGAVCIALLTSGWYGAQAGQAGQEPGLPNFDRRQAGADKAVQQDAAHRAALDALRERVPDAVVDLDEITGMPRRVTARRGFLSGPKGEGRGVSAKVAREFALEDPHRAAKAFLQEHRAVFGHGPEALAGATVKREFVTAHNGLKTVVWEQHVDDIPVFNGLLTAHTTKDGELVNLSSQFLPDPVRAADAGTPPRGAKRNVPLLTPKQAVARAAQNLGERLAEDDVSPVGAEAEGAHKKQRFRAASLSGPAEASLVWLPLNKSELRLCWEVLLTSRVRGEMFRVLIDARTGETLLRHGLTAYISDATYRVFTRDSPSPFSPGHPMPATNQPPLVPRLLVVTAALNTNASPGGWINDGDNETRGNNVDAHLDRNNDNSPDLPRPQGSPSRVFDFPLDLTQSPTTYGDAAVVQLFYWCNWYHDKLYELGFTEAAGNFQVNNFGRGGAGNDAVQADAQDGGGFNNANFSTPPDGSPGRMQMYVFNGVAPSRDGSLDAEVILHEHTHGLSNRRVGGGVGLTALQSQGMGEGWSDFFALALLSEPGDDVNGNYAAGAYLSFLLGGLRENYYYGIRRYPYTTDLNRNPLTFRDIDPAQASTHPGVPRSILGAATADEVHNQGELWCVTLWDARANLINKYGDATGNHLILQLVTDGMNLSPANPNFIEARDAILQADLVNNAGANRNELWAGFAKRGLGFTARSPASSTTAGLHEAFDPPDDLSLTPFTGFTASGPVGGPFAGTSQTYTLTNIGTSPITFVITRTASWLNLSATNGTLDPAGPSAAITVSLNAAAASLPMGIYSGLVSFTNLTSGVGQSRSYLLLVGQPDYFTEQFGANDNDLDFQTLTFTPDGSTSFYAVCHEGATSFPTDPAGGTSVTLTDDSFAQVVLSGTNRVSIYTNRADTFFIGSNGYLTCRQGDTAYLESPSAHFTLPRITALFDDLNPAAGGAISWKQLSNRVAVTWLNVPEYGSFNQNSFQIEMFFDGVLRITWLRLDALDGLAGLSAGAGLPAGFIESDLSAYGSCAPRLVVSAPAQATEGDGVLVGRGRVSIPSPLATNLTIHLVSSNTNEADVPPAVLLLAGQTNAAFDITIVDDAILDGTQAATLTAATDHFTDGTATIAVSDNETATLSLSPPLTVREGDAPTPLVLSLSAPPGADVQVALTSSDPTEIQVPASVVLPAGQTSLVFNVTVIDDTLIDGAQSVTLTAHVENWTDGLAALTVLDNEPTQLVVILPPQLSEASGTLTNAASVRLAGLLPTNLVVALVSSDLTELIVPPTVTIAAGQFSVSFNLTLVDDPNVDGAQTVTVTATAPGFTAGSTSMIVSDDESPPLPSTPYPPHLSTNILANVDLSWGAGEGEQIVNGGFESGDFSGWTKERIGGGDFVINDGTFDPASPDIPLAVFEGGFNAVTDQTGPGQHTLFQDVFVPFGADPVTLRWADRIRNHGPAFSDNQRFRVEIRSTNNAVLALAYSTRPGDPLLNDWVQRGFDLSAYRGQTIRIAFIEQDNAGYFNVHLDRISMDVTPGGTNTYDVYFGVNPAPGPAEFLGSTTNMTWHLPRLAPLTTFYWQIIARRSGTTAGPVWQFTTRGLHHFEWSTVASPQLVNQPFTVAVTAKDVFNTTVTNFTGSASLSGQGAVTTPELFRDGFEDGDISDWTIQSGDYLRAVTNTTAATGAFSVTLTGGAQTHFDGIAHTLSNITPARIDFYARASQTNRAGGYFLVGASTASIAGYFFFNDDGFIRFTGVPATNHYEANRWYRISMDFHWETKRLDYSVDDVLVLTNLPFSDPSLTSLATLHLYNFSHTQAWWDDIEITQAGTAVPIALSPTHSGNFTNGSWSGAVTVTEPAGLINLLADDRAGHTGLSNPFRVVVENDLDLTATDSPDPVTLGQPLAYTLTLTNTGPALSTSVTLTNFLPTTVSFLSAVASQGSCVNTSGQVRCALGALPTGTNAVVTILVTPNVLGSLTNRVVVARAEADPYLANNTAILVTTVTPPTLSISDATVREGDSGRTNILFIVRLSASNRIPVTVSYATGDGTAIAGTDYFSTNGTLIFPPGALTQFVTVAVSGDASFEADETFVVTLSSPVNAILSEARGVGTILNDDPAPPAAYIRSTNGVPWGSTANETALNRVFGASGWQDLRYETLNVLNLLSPRTHFIFMEGSDNNADELENFLNTRMAALQDWVSNGGVLFLNAAPNEGDGMNLGFGVTLTYPDFTDSGQATLPSHPIFNGPFTPVGLSWTANNFGHATVSGGGLVSLIDGAATGRSVLGEKPYGAGAVLCGGMTTDNFHTPQPQASNLRANLLAYGISLYTPPGALHHFNWSPVASPKLLHLPFPVTLTAVDGFNTVVTNFNSTVALSAFTGDSQTNATILAGPNHSQTDCGVWTLGYAFTPATNILVTHLRHYFGTKVSLWTDAGVLITSQNVSSVPGTWTETPLVAPVQLLAGNRYRIAAFTGGADFYSRADMTASFPFGHIHQSYEVNGDNFPTTSDSIRWWFVDLRFTVGNLAGFPIAPTVSGSFTNGVWSGAITPLAVAAGVRLIASDSLGHFGTSESFTVAIMNDLTLTLADGPDPILAGRLLKYTLLLANTGPAPATGVLLTNLLPPTVSFVSASTSQGACTRAGDAVICDIGTMTAAQNVVVAIIVQPTAPGILTNVARVSRNEPDSVPSNNVAVVTTTVFVPTLSIDDATVVEGNSGASEAEFRVRLSELSPLTVTVEYATADFTAVAGSDYHATNGVLTFPPGATNRSIRVAVRGDTLHEADERFRVNLTNAVNAALADAQATGLILNDDPPPVLSISDAAVVEGQSGMTNAVFTVSLSAPSGEPVRVFYYTLNGTATGGTDYFANPGPALVFGPGVTNLTISVIVFGDTTVEADETFSVVLFDPEGAVLGDNTGIGTILNDDFATVIVRDSSILLLESRVPPNGAIDPNETVTVNFALKNVGNIDTTNLAVTLLATGGVTAPGPSQTYGALVGGGPAVGRPFTFTASGANAGALIATLQLQDGARNLGTVAFGFNLGAVREFRILSLSDAGCSAIEDAGVTGDDRGGLAASSSQVFSTGDTTTGRFALSDLSGGTGAGFQYDALTANLRTETVYSLGSGTNVIGFGGGIVTSLLELNGASGALTGHRIDLSEPVVVTNSAGLFAGYDRVVLHDGLSQVYNIALPSGAVTPLGHMTNPPHALSESWAYWGVAEYGGGAVYLVYVRDAQSIVRTRVPEGDTTLIQGFNNLGDMASITVSLSRNRWYFHHEGESQFRSGDETIGYCGATFLLGPPALDLDHFEWSAIPSPQSVNVPFPATLTARDAFGNAITTFNGPVHLRVLDVSVSHATIGAGAGTWEFPLAGFFHDARTQVIYLPEEIGGPRPITALALDVQTGPGQTLSNWTIRLKHTSLTGFGPAPAWEASGWTLAHQSAANITAAGWVTFPFTAPFDYNGADSLMVDFSFNNSSFSSDGFCRASLTAGTRAIYFETDSFFGDPLLWSGAFSPMPAAAAQIPNVRLFSATSVPAAPTVSGLFTNGVWSGDIAVLQGPIQGMLCADDGMGHAGSSNPFHIVGVPELHIRGDGSNAILTWPVATMGYRIESANSLAPAVWQPVAEPSVAWGSFHVVTNSLTSSNRFYRLRSP